jgi:hypothetical protein
MATFFRETLLPISWDQGSNPPGLFNRRIAEGYTLTGERGLVGFFKDGGQNPSALPGEVDRAGLGLMKNKMPPSD